MKIKINEVKQTPPNMDFGLCVYGKPNEEVTEWCEHWGLATEESGAYTNIILNDDSILEHMFEGHTVYKYMDGFSPNLNKHLHVGHLSNLVFASAFSNMGVTAKTITILGDTLEGEVAHKDALEEFVIICNQFNYYVDDYHYASMVECDHELLVAGEDDYEGTLVFDLGEEKIVGLKSDGNTTYFYQDVALATQLNDDTLYLTGAEQENHFTLLKTIAPKVNHLPLGLVMVGNNKLSSRNGNAMLASELIAELMEKLDNNIELVVNIIKGQFLKSKPNSTKNIWIKDMLEPKTSSGLYLSYTMARLLSAGLALPTYEDILADSFISKEIQFAYIKAKINMMPNTLLEALVEHCKMINTLYIDHHIKDNPENQKMFQPMLEDLSYGMLCLGMYEVTKV